MARFFDLYWSYIKTFFRARAEYRFGFISGLFSNFYCYFITFAIFWVLTNRFNTIGGWGFADLSVLYGLNLLTYAISGTLIWYTVYHLGREITTGGLDRFLTRPLGILGQLICQRFGDTFIGQIVVTLVFLVTAFIKLVDTFTPLTIIYIVLAIISGVLIQTGGMILIGSISFWTMRSSEIGDIVYYDIRSLTEYPLVIYPKWIKIILTYVFPWAFINYYPALIILGKESTKLDIALGWLSPLVGITFLSIALLVFNKGLKRYAGAGS